MKGVISDVKPYLQVPALIQKHVFGLDVAIHQVLLLVHVLQCQQGLANVEPRPLLAEVVIAAGLEMRKQLAPRDILLQPKRD